MNAPSDPNPTPKRKAPAQDGESLRQLVVVDEETTSSHLGARLRGYFLTGLIVVGPVAITIYVVWWFITLIDNWVKPLVPPQYPPEHYLPFSVPGVGLIFGITGLIVIGALTANLFGRTLVGYSERMLARMPIVRSVYRTLKQIFETVLSKNGGSFKRVGLIEFPRRGLYSIVFLAGDPPPEVDEKIGGGNPLITVFMPNGPNPTTGFILFRAGERGDRARSLGGGRRQARGVRRTGCADQQDRLRELAKRKGAKQVPEEEPAV